MVILPGSGRASPSILTLNVSSVRAHRSLPSSAGVIGSRPLRMATTALNPALNIPSRGSERFAAAPTAVGGPTPMSGRRAGLGDLGNGGLGQVRRDEDGTRHREVLPPVRLLWVELRQASEQFPGLDCKKPYRGKNSSGVTVCHDPLLGPAARDTAATLTRRSLVLVGTPAPDLTGRPASAIAPPGARLDKKLSSTGSSMTTELVPT